MRFAFDIARRYLFGKKSTNAIKVITGVSVIGISIGAAALVLILSVFNGFEDLLTGLFNAINADIRVTAMMGKTFDSDSIELAKIRSIDGIMEISQTLEEIALLDFNGTQDFCTVKGVDENFKNTTTIDSAMLDGIFALKKGTVDQMVLGAGIAHRLNINLGNPFDAVAVYAPNRKQRGPLDKAFKTQYAYPIGQFSIKQDYDYQYVFTNIEFLQRLLDLDGKVSALEIKLSPGASEKQVIRSLKKQLGPNFEIKNRYQQDEAFFKLMNLEKWISFAIISLTLIIVSFNLVGALWMIVLDKRKDISILKSMGSTREQIRQIFLNEGLLISGLGIVIGFILALSLYGLQKIFGIVPIPEGFVVDAYPTSIRWRDFIIVAITVLLIGFLASLLPSHRASKIKAYVREE